MKETDRIIKLFEDLYDGDPWIDVTLTGTLKKITPAQAAKRVLPACNSVWEIVDHLIKWRLAVLGRVNGKTITAPDHNYFEPIKDISKKAWQQTLDELEDTQEQWIRFLSDYKAGDFKKIYPANNSTHYEHIQGIIQHDAYHLGQIVLLVKQSGN